MKEKRRKGARKINNRHIYRGKRVDNGEWAFGCNSYDGAGRNTIDVINNLDEYEEMFVIDPDTLGQCTGLKDKTGTLIWEGDIIQQQINDYVCERRAIKWDDNTASFICGAINNIRYYIFADTETIEVIGNIHDNPELLREGENGET